MRNQIKKIRSKRNLKKWNQIFSIDSGGIINYIIVKETNYENY